MHTRIDEMIGTLRRDAARYAAAAQRQCDVFLGSRAAQPLLLEAAVRPPDAPRYTPLAQHTDSEKMLYEQLWGAMAAQAGGREAVPSVRANMGCGIVPALFGLRQEVFDDKMPWLREHLDREAILAMRPEDLRFAGEFQLALDHMAYMRAALAGSGVYLYPVDIQGPFDTAHLVYGDDIFYALYDDPALVHHLLALSCEAIFMAQDACLRLGMDTDRFVPHYSSLVMPRSLGGIKLSEDTSTLLGAAQIDEFVAPYIHRVLARYGGGYIHYCGQNPHLYRAVMAEPLAWGINFGNPDMHDMGAVLRDCAARGKVYYGAIPKAPGDTPAAYFDRLLDAARRPDGGYALLLSLSAPPEDCPGLRDAWDAALLRHAAAGG